MKWQRFKYNVKSVFAPVPPGRQPRPTFTGHTPDEHPQGRMARCSVCGDSSYGRNEVVAHDIERAHWDTKHV